MYYGDIALGDTIDVKFTSRKFSTGAPFTLAGTPAVSAYVDNGTTEITAGITLTVDFDARTGLNHVRVVATSGNGYAVGTNVVLVITAGTVDSVSVVGEVIGSFSIEKRSALRPTTAGRTLDVTATGAAGVDWANVENPTTAVGLSGTTVKTATDVETDTQDLQSRVPAALVSGRMASDAVAISGSTVAADAVETNIGNLDASIAALNNLSAADVNAEVDTALADYDGPTYTELLNLIRVALRKDAALATDLSTLLTSLNADLGSGAGAYANTTDAQEAIRDRGDAAWTTATGFSTLDAAGVRTAVGLASANLDTQLAAIDDAVDTEVAAILAAVDTEVAAIKAKTDNLPASPAATSDIPTAAAIADAVWDEAIAGHAGAGSTGEALSNAGAAGTPPTAAEVADAVWDETLADHLGAGSTGAGLNAAGSAGDPWATALPGAYGAGTAGKILGDNLDAAVSSRSTLDAAGVRTAVGLASANLDTQLDALPTAPEIRAEIDANSTKLDVAVSSRLATAGYTAPDNASITAIQAKTDNLPTDPADESLLIAATDAIFARLGAPAGASVSADMAATKADTAAIKAKTDSLTFTVAGEVDANVRAINDTAVQGDGSSGNKWRPA